VPVSVPVSVPSTVSAAVSSTEPVPDGGVGPTWTVVEVVDGDTIRVDGPGGEQRVRLIGVNAPELGECFHDEATERLRELVAGSGVRLVSDESDTDRFDRLLRFVETVDGTDVNGELVRSGVARSQRYEPDVSRNDRYDALQTEAQQARRGLWAPDACGAPVASADVRIGVDLQYDAPGDDNLNLNGEWVRFTNEGAAGLDLTGWLLADESSTHRYRFDELVLPPGGSVTVFTGCGTDSQTERYWCNEGSAVWNNSGDTVFLQDPNGNVVVSQSYRG
jgi:micrococcal nuclease